MARVQEFYKGRRKRRNYAFLPFLILLAEILSRKNTDARQSPENCQVIDKYELIGDGDAGKLLGAHLSAHNIIQKVDKVGDQALHHDRHHDSKSLLVKNACTEKAAPAAGCFLH